MANTFKDLSNIYPIGIAIFGITKICCYPGVILNQTLDKFIYPDRWVDTYKSPYYKQHEDRKTNSNTSRYKGGSGIPQYTIWDWEKDASDSKSGPNFF